MNPPQNSKPKIQNIYQKNRRHTVCTSRFFDAEIFDLWLRLLARFHWRSNNNHLNSGYLYENPAPLAAVNKLTPLMCDVVSHRGVYVAASCCVPCAKHSLSANLIHRLNGYQYRIIDKSIFSHVGIFHKNYILQNT